MTNAQALRHQLRNGGYCPIPLFGKEPPIYGKNNKRKGLKQWEELGDITAEQIDLWTKIWPDAINTGCLCRFMPTLDLDILNEGAVRTVEDHVREHYEESGYITGVAHPTRKSLHGLALGFLIPPAGGLWKKPTARAWRRSRNRKNT
jgi:hypothetical protein